MHAEAAVLTGQQQFDLRAIAVPDDLGDGELLLSVDACGLCGTDVEQFNGHLADMGVHSYPCIPGHEPVGTVTALGSAAAESADVSVGDRVAVESLVPCENCRACAAETRHLCEEGFNYGMEPLSKGFGLWGGFAEFMILRPNSVVHPIPDWLSDEDAVFFNPLAAGVEWIHRRGNAQAGDSVLILGPGVRGLACTIAAASVGAAKIIVTGLERDRGKLEIAEELGATHTIIASDEDVRARIREITTGRGVDLAIDVTPGATKPITDAIDVTATNGTVLLAGLKGMKSIPDFVSDTLILNNIDVKGLRGTSERAYRKAVDIITTDSVQLDRLHTHTFPLQKVETAIDVMANQEHDERIHITLVP